MAKGKKGQNKSPQRHNDASENNKTRDGEATEKLSEAELLKIENEELNNRILRLRADFDNFRKRTIKERQDIARRSNEKLITELLPALDHFEMGLQNARENNVPAAVYDGLKIVQNQLLNALEKVGVSRIDAEGEEFNPHLHECVSHLPSDEFAEGIASNQTRCGYKLGDYILRAAQVVVSSGPTAPENTVIEKENNNTGEE